MWLPVRTDSVSGYCGKTDEMRTVVGKADGQTPIQWTVAGWHAGVTAGGGSTAAERPGAWLDSDTPDHLTRTHTARRHCDQPKSKVNMVLNVHRNLKAY